MCGRYSIITTVQQIADHFEVQNEATAFTPNANISAGEQAPVITSQNPDKLQLFTFGFTPHWAQKPTYLINARSEGDYNKTNTPDYSGPMGIITKPMFRHAVRNQRCLIPFNGFIEGPEKEKLNKPYYFHFNNRTGIHSFAGIYDEWINKNTGEILRGFAILTTISNNATEKIGHHRSPVILTTQEEKIWLDSQINQEHFLKLLKPWNSTEEQIFSIPISSKIKSPTTKTIEFLTNNSFTVNEQLSLFGMGETRARNRSQ
jgi:putative SOS response-associated peptidase YedK